MARIRSTFPGQWTDEDFVGCQPLARLLIIGLRNEADDQGVFEWKPVGLKMKLMPVDNVDMEALLADLEAHRQIIKFTAHGKVYGAIRNFVRFQRPKKPTKVHPLPADLHDWVRMDMWGAKKKAGSEPDADQHDDGSEPDGNEAACGSEPTSCSNRRRSEPTPTTKGVGSELSHASTSSSSELGTSQRTVSSEPKPSQRTRVPKSSEMAAQREEGGGNKEEARDAGIGESSAGGLHGRTRDGPTPPAEGDDPGISQPGRPTPRSGTEG
ncbi:hypothetical protein GAY28_35745, partial [Azospirillum brasilense]|nr:hypothetical protein [Azospirillum brasilense]